MLSLILVKLALDAHDVVVCAMSNIMQYRVEDCVDSK